MASLFSDTSDPNADQYHPVAQAGDTYELAAGKPSIFSQAYDVATKGTLLTGVSIVRSFWNTGKQFGNWLGADFGEQSTAEEFIKSVDYSGDMFEYYKQHEQGIEAAGLVVGSFIPGMLAAKAVKLASGAAALGGFGRMMGYQDKLMQTAITFNNERKAVTAFEELKAAKFAGIAAGFGEQAVVAAAWEVATLATMHANPTISQDGFKESASHVFYGALTGGVIGGTFSGFVMNGVLKKGLINAESRELTKQLITDMGLAAIGGGDRAVTTIAHMDDILKAATAEGPKALETATRTADRARQQASADLGRITPEFDKGVQDELLNFLLAARKDGNVSAEDIYDKLAGLGKIRRIKPEDAIESEEFSKIAAALKLEGPRTEEQIKLLNKPKDIPIRKDATEEETLSAPRILNIKTGDESNIAYGVLGDFGPTSSIRLSVNKNAVVVGEGASIRVFEQVPPSKGFGTALAQEAPTSAHARYVYAEKRGILPDIDMVGKRGISIEDLPFMEEMYRNWPKYQKLDEHLVLIGTDGKRIEGDWTNLGGFGRLDIAQHIIEQKKALVKRLIEEGKNIEDIALRANVPIKAIEDGTLFKMQASEVDGMMRPISELTSTNHVALQYDLNAMKGVDGNLVVGMQHVQQRIEDAVEEARTYATKFFTDTGAPVPEQFFASKTVMQADTLGASPGFLTNRDPDPKSLAAMAQNVGAAFKKHFEKLRSEVYDRLGPRGNVLIKNKPEAGAEVAILDNAMRGTGQKYELLHPDSPQFAEKIDALNKARIYIPEGTEGFLVRKGLFEITDKGKKIVVNEHLPDEPGFLSISEHRKGIDKGKLSVYTIQHRESVDFMLEHFNINRARRQHYANFLDATGSVKDARDVRAGLDLYYTPPVDTSKAKYVVFVKEPTGKGGASSEVHAITAVDAASLQAKIKNINDAFPEYEVFTKEQIKREYQNRGEYDPSLNMQQLTINSKLARKGIFSDIQPDLNPENLVDNYLRWHGQQTRRLVSNFTELGNGQLFAELKHLGEQYSDLAASKVGFIASKLGGKQERNPFQEYVDTMLDISPKYHFPLWQDTNEKVEALYNTAFNTATKVFKDAQKGLISWDKATELTERMGLGNPYKNAESLVAASARIPPSQLQVLVRTGNSLVAATQVRLDAFQSLINVVSTPVLLLAQASSAKFAALKEATSVGLPGSEHVVPSGTKVLYDGIKAFWNKEERTLLMKEFQDRGLVPEVRGMQNYHAMIEDLSAAPGSSKFRDRMSSAVEMGAKLSGSNWAEEFTRFVTAHAGKQLYEAQGLVGEELWSATRTFMNRVQGNYIASQRPVVFQGVLGQAVGLFQTYQFNMMQQLFRFVEEGDKRTLAILGAMQGTLYGMQGLPGFNILNTHIVGNAAGNASHSDIFTGVNSYAGKDVGNYLLYGGLSNILNTGLYSRGDINPRQVSVLPINPIDWPAIAGAKRLLDDVKSTAEKIAKGGNLYQSLLFGIEHNGLSRPLAGVAQITQGFSTTQGNSLVSAIDWATISNASRVFGSKPLDEAIAMDAMYRKKVYDAASQESIKKLGGAVRTTMFKGETPTPDQITEFHREATEAGMRPERFGAFMVDSMKKANTPAANEVIRHLNSPTAQNLYKLMGGETLPDFTIAGSVTGSTATAPLE